MTLEDKIKQRITELEQERRAVYAAYTTAIEELKRLIATEAPSE
jgi:hypothetical protein